MIIAASAINLTSDHILQEEHTVRETMTAWQAGRQPQVANGSGAARDARAFIAQQEAVLVDVSAAGKAQPRFVQGLAEEIAPEDMPIADLKMRILKALFERMFGKKIDIEDPARFTAKKPTTAAPAGEKHDAANDAAGEEGWGIIYEYYESHYEQEQTDFSAEGTIVTADGKEISFQAQLTMSREFFSEEHISLRAGDALKDPLVINFAGTGAELSDTRFAFDIDHDGVADQIHFVGTGSGFLALDRNGDEVINDGSELFGPLSGEGFAELQQFDSDHNGWIDENDAIYDRLRIWTRDEAGQSHLFSLGQKGVGAIYLEHVNTPFALKDDSNNLQGQVRSTGLFLSENGSTGTIQQIDLAV
ncbi:MAG: hypothetical protein V2J11_07365 [Desulfofustis sp.]|nr:hypothetical protein [Desulfofustis sp.]